VDIVVAGASGFVGSRLTPLLVTAGHRVRAMTRRPEAYDGDGTAVAGDVGDQPSLVAAFAGAEAVIYLVHSLASADFRRMDADAARAVARAAADAGVRRLVYLGGLGDDRDDLSAHLRSRREVERLLGATGVPVTVLRAGIIIGAGGISWEMTRQITQHLPAMIAPRWVSTRTQPIAVCDVVAYLAGVLKLEETAGVVYEIGGPEVLRYREMIERVATIMGLRRRLIVSVPLLTPGLSSHWLRLITDVDLTTARSLIDSMNNEVVVRDDAITRVLPRELLDFDGAVRVALAERDRQREERSGAPA